MRLWTAEPDCAVLLYSLHTKEDLGIVIFLQPLYMYTVLRVNPSRWGNHRSNESLATAGLEYGVGS